MRLRRALLRLARRSDARTAQSAGLSETDALTGLPTRGAVTEHVLRRQQQTDGDIDAMALLLIDLDDFKVVNDSLGRDAGDQLLMVVASRLLSSVEDGDLVARLDGDQFVIVNRHGNDPTAAVAAARRILASLGSPEWINGTAVTIGCGIGIALSGPGSVSTGELLQQADIARSMAKSRGKNQLEVFAHAANPKTLAPADLRADLIHATELGQLELVYQPVIDLTGDQVLGWEALVRWRHPERGVVSPAEFIPAAEDNGYILAIDKWVLNRACEDFAQTLGCTGQSARWVSVNISARQLLEPEFVVMVRQSLHRWGLEPGSLVLEITEGALSADQKTAADALSSLQRDGVRIALDDFGTRTASLRDLPRLPVDIIKIDRSFVTLSGESSSDTLDAIVSLGDTLGLDMIAEGIEEFAELERVMRFDRVAGQGYYIARPMPVANARTFSFKSMTVR